MVLVKVILFAGALGLCLGALSVPEVRTWIGETWIEISSSLDARTRKPQAGDWWRDCNDARAAGTAPIYSYEPGYRSELDRDADGIACEPYH
nr:excalibur calcium-binding domain-containing protein [Novosphingobium decolorationis]